MGVLCDWQIKDLIYQNELITPYDTDLINPASIDVRVGDTYRRELVWPDVPRGKERWSDPLPFPSDGLALRYPMQILVDTLEYVKIPNHLMAEMWLKSSAGRKGYNTYKAGYIDPGFHGTVTFRLWNDTRLPVVLRSGDRVIQLVFREMSRVPQKSYQQTGRYNGQRGPTVAREKKGGE